MGNTHSGSDTEDEANVRNFDESGSENEDLEKECQASSDLETLFNHTTLRSVASKIKEEIPENVIQQHRYQIIRWLDDRESKSEETVTLAQFCDMLMNKPGVSREDAIKAFQQFDTDGTGVVEVNTILSAIKFMNGPNMMGELGKSIRMLQACSLTPGFVDVYSEHKNAVNQHAERILKYLLRNRAPSNSLPFPYLNGFNNTSSMRLSVLKHTFISLKDASKSQIGEASLSDGEEVRLLNPCYSSLEVSTNPSEAYRLTNNVPNTFWQSDGSARSHWIRLHMKPNVVVKGLSISVQSSDSSYMPEQISVTAGRNTRSLREIKEVRIPSHANGDIELLKNAKTYYPIVQINIKRCRNDGCDTRVHGLKALGYKVVKEEGISVADSAATWFLQVLASTVTASIPVAPRLQRNLLAHSQKTMETIPPLSLCPASGEKPRFLSKLVLLEVEKFLTDIAVQEKQVLSDGVHLMLAYNLARGHVGGLLRTLKLLQENPEFTFPCTKLMAKMFKARDTCWERTGHQLQVTISGCDGGFNDEHSRPENVLSASWTDSSPAYVTEEGKMKVNMFFKTSEYIQVTRIRIKVSSGQKGAKRGLVFVYRDSKEFDLEEHVERFKGYDSWGKIEYDFSVQVRNAGIAGKPDNPVAYFVFDDDCDEIEIPAHWHPTGQYILVKFLEPRHDSAGKISIIGVKFCGFVRKPVLVEDTVVVKHPPNAEKKPSCTSLEIIKYVSTFIVDIAQDQAQRRGISARPEYLDFSDIPLEMLCGLYHAFKAREDEKWKDCSLLVLQMVYCLLPVFSSVSGESKISAEALFQHLCKVVDSPEIDQTSKLYRLSKQLIIDGAAVFFSDKETRKKQLFSMMQKVETLSETPSVMLVFQSLCQFFSSVDPRGLLDLPKVTPENFKPDPVLDVMEMMIMVTFHEFSLVIQSEQTNEQLIPLLQLVSSLQTSLLSWAWGQMTENGDVMKPQVGQMATRYAILVAQKASDAVRLLLNKDLESLEKLIAKIETSFLGSVVRQMLLVMSYMSTNLNSMSRVTLLKNLHPLNQELVKLATLVPSVFPNITSDHWQTVQTDDIVLRTWEVESAHNYENSMHFTQIFSCPGANKFLVEFDPRCETERRYDYLVFTDAKGMQMKFDQKVGTPKWPKQIQFVGPHVHFLFHSDSSNTEWGYKFKVTARGSPDTPLSWPFDLQLGLTRLMGMLCGATLNANPVLPRDQLMELEEVAEQDILRSELWTTLFRGGYMIGKLQRSLSGKYTSEDSGQVLEFLWEMINGGEKTANFLKRVKEHNKGLHVGGENVDSAVTAVFSALVWQTQQLRDEMEKYIHSASEGDGPISESLYQAYNTAESVRTSVVTQRQKLAVEADEKKKLDVNDPATVCKDKALYLLKFAGLTKIQLKQELMRSRSTKQMKKPSSKRADRNKFEGSEKYPSFRLILEFVQDPAWNTERVHNMLQERSQHAQAVAEVYMIATEVVRLFSVDHPFQILVVLFLQEMLCFQDGFAKHYAEGLDGCGLEQEAKVRLAFYTLIRRLTEAYHKFNRHELDKKVHPAYDYIQACLLHLLNIQWQPYDLSFISDVRLPDLFSGVAKETVKMRDCLLDKQDETEELNDYEKHMKWFNECRKENFVKWYKSKEDLCESEKKAVQMFIARFCDLLEVEVNCDGCNVTLPGRRYRCLQCTDMDLCTTCYSGGVKPEKHTDDHDIIHLVYKCNKCQAFIVGTRIHCNVCEDFDLCFGCHLKGNLPSGHLATHDVTKFPLMKLKTSQDTDSLIQAYIHQHVWMLFTLLAISMSDVIYNNEGNTSVSIDQEYASLAAQLQNKCISISMHCLQKVPDDAEDSNKNFALGVEQSLECRQEEAFSIHSQERIMGLLGAMIPHDTNAALSGSSYNFMTEEFLRLLFKISRGESGHEVNTRHLAMGLLGLLLTKCPVQVADNSVEAMVEEGSIEGYKTIKYLFSFGAACLEKSGLEWACSVARILQQLCCSAEWKLVLHHHLTNCVQNIAQKPELSSIFAMFVMAGFPEVLTTGTLVSYNHTGVETKTGVVLKHYPDKHSTLVVDVKSRKRHTVSDKYIDCFSLTTEVWDSSNIVVFLNIIGDIVDKQTKGDESLTVEELWVLSLALKLLHNSLKSVENCTIDDLYTPDFIQCLVSTASKGTGFSQQWLLKDLEVLSLMLYTHEGCPPTHVKKASSRLSIDIPSSFRDVIKASVKLASRDEDSDTFSDSSSSTSSDAGISMPEDSSEIFDEVDEKTKLIFKALRNDLNLPISVLRAIYDMNDRNADSVVKAILENFEGASAHPKEIVKKLTEKWEAIRKTQNPEALLASVISEKVIDTGIHYHPSLNHRERTLEKASEETAVDTQRLIHCPDNDVQDEIIKQRRTKSAELLKVELEKHGKSGTREYLTKVNMAMAVLYARQVLTSLLAHWPEYGHMINSKLLGCKEIQQIPCVLDLLNKTEKRENFQKVVRNLVRHSETESLVPIARTACQFMEEVTLSVVTKESDHNYKAKDISNQTIQLPGASFLTVTFDSKCSTREDEDELIFATSKDFQHDRHVFSGSSRGQWSSFQVPGDTIFYKFACESGRSDTHWGFKFTVTAGTRDSFETGYIILSDVLTSHLAVSLPLSELWTSLVYVASKQTGTQRLKTIQLLLKIIQTQHRNNETQELGIELALLRPLYQLYTNMTKKESDPSAILPPVTRALTELFLQVENLAIEWNIVTEYLVSMQDPKDLRMAVYQGLQKVVAVSLMIGYKNHATDAVIAAIKKKKSLESVGAESKPVI